MVFFSIPFDAPLTGKPYYVKDNTNNDEFIFVSAINGEVCAVDIKNKEKLWCKKSSTAADPYSFSSFEYDSARNILWYASLEGEILGINPKSGNFVVKDAAKKSTDNYAAVSIDGNILYHMDIEGTLKKFDINWTINSIYFKCTSENSNYNELIPNEFRCN